MRLSAFVNERLYMLFSGTVHICNQMLHTPRFRCQANGQTEYQTNPLYLENTGTVQFSWEKCVETTHISEE